MTPTPPAVAQDVTRVTLSVAGIAVLIAGSLMVLRPFIVSLLWATMIVVSTWPFMLKVQARLGGRRGAAVASMTVILLLVLFVPLYLAFATIIEESERVIEYAHALPVLQIPPPPRGSRACRSSAGGLPSAGRSSPPCRPTSSPRGSPPT